MSSSNDEASSEIDEPAHLPDLEQDPVLMPMLAAQLLSCSAEIREERPPAAPFKLVKEDLQRACQVVQQVKRILPQWDADPPADAQQLYQLA